MTAPGWLVLLACVGLARAITRSVVLQAARDRARSWLLFRWGTGAEAPCEWRAGDYLAELLRCPACLGFWVGLALSGGSIIAALASYAANLIVDAALERLGREG